MGYATFHFPSKAIAISGTTLPAIHERAKLDYDFGKLPLRFEQNSGQSGKQAQFIARNSGATVLLTRNKALLTLPDAKNGTLQLQFIGASKNVQLRGEDPLPTISNYLLGSDPHMRQVKQLTVIQMAV